MATTLTFQELGGSPIEQYTYDGFTATRIFLVPWEQKTAFATAVFGKASSPIAQRRLTYPCRSATYAYKLRYEPFDPEAISVRELPELKNYVNYNGSFVKAIVDYHTLDEMDRGDGPINEEGTSITYKMTVESQEMILPQLSWKWSDNGTQVSALTEIRKVVPTTVHHITWSNVLNPPWTTISAAQGKINNARFCGCETGTLLLEGAEANKLYKPGSGLEEGPSVYVWAIQYKFRERSVKMNGQAIGWNRVYRPENGTWANVTNASNLYDSTNFNVLFRSVLPDDMPW